MPAKGGLAAGLGVAEAQKQGDPSMLGAPSPYGIIPLGTGDVAAQSLPTALAPFNMQDTPAGTMTPNSGVPLPMQADPSMQAGTTVGDVPSSVRDVSNSIMDAQTAGMPSFTGLPETNAKRPVLSNSPDMGAPPAPQMAGADVPLPPVRPPQALIDALAGGPASGVDPTSTGSIAPQVTTNQTPQPDMAAPNAQPTMGQGLPGNLTAGGPGGGFSPIGKNAGFETPQAFNLAQSGGAPSMAAMLAAPSAPAGQDASPFQAGMNGGDLQAATAKRYAQLLGNPDSGQGAPQPDPKAMAGALDPSVIRAPAAAPAAGGWQQLAADTISDPYADENMKRYAVNLLEKQNPQPRALQSVSGPDGQLYVFDPSTGSFSKGPEGTRAPTNHFVSMGDGGVLDTQTGQVQRAPQDGPKPMFDGKSTEGQALNYLIGQGKITQDQAAQYAAGKTVTDPSTGAVTYLTPDGFIKALPGGAPSPSGQPGAAPPPQGGGMVPLTAPKPQKFSEGESNAAGFATRMGDAEKVFGQPGIQAAETSAYQRNANAVPFIGNYLASSDYQQADHGAEERHPIAAAAAEIAGGIANPAAIALAPEKLAATLGGKVAQGAAYGAGFGALQGAAGSQDLTNLPQVASDAGTSAVFGAGMGGALPVAGQALGAAYRSAAPMLAGNVDGIRGAASGIVSGLMSPEAQARLAALGPDAMPVDASRSLQGLGAGVAAIPGKGADVMASALQERAAGQSGRLMADREAALGPAMSPDDVAAAMQSRRDAALPLLAQADAQGPLWNPQLASLAERPATQAALRNASDTAANEGRPLPTVMLGENGQQVGQQQVAAATQAASRGAVDQAVGALLGNQGGTLATADQIMTQRAAAADPLYAAARSATIPDGAIPIDLLQRLQRAGALEEAQRTMGLQGRSFDIGNVEAWDLMKRSLDDSAGSALSSGQRHAASIYTGLKNEVTQDALAAFNDHISRAQQQFTEAQRPDVRGWRYALDHLDGQAGKATGAAAQAIGGTRDALRGQLQEIPAFARADQGIQAANNGQAAFDAGRGVLRDGAVFPVSHAAAFDALPLEQQALHRAGARSDIEQQFGSNRNDLSALARLLGDENDFGRAKMQTLFGEDARSALVAALDREKTFANSTNRITQASNTGQTNAGAAFIKDKTPDEVIPKGSTWAGLLGNTAEKAGRAVVGGALKASGERTRQDLAKILAMPGPEFEAHMAKARGVSGASRDRAAALAAALASPAAIRGAVAATGGPTKSR